MKDLVLSILNIFKHAGNVLRFIRNAIFNTLLLLLAVAMVGYLVSSSPRIPGNSILNLRLAGDIVEERRPSSAFGSLFTGTLGAEDKPEYTVLQDILDMIETAATDAAIRAILLDLGDLGSVGLDQMQTIGAALDTFRQQGKKVFAAGDYYTQKQYYLAAHADTIILNPMGGVEMHGFGIYPLYFKDALDKLQVNYHIFRVGTYKSAIEPIVRNSMSEEARSQNLSWLNMLWDTYTSDVAAKRGLSAAALNEYIDQIDTKLAAVGGDTAKLALDSHLVDLLLTREELDDHLKTAIGSSTLSLVTTEKYLSVLVPSFTEVKEGEPEIGIIVAEGNILGGKQPAGTIGSESLSQRLRKARENNAVKAVVVRINSGGGSAFASEIIRQEILELKKTGKPVVVSMGTMAASGGYWISANASQIWASPVTLTGSIGIFGAIPTFEHSLASLGIHSDGVGTTDLAAGVNLARPLEPRVKESIQLTVDNGYDRFLSIVEKGRNIDREELSRIAEGRVFSGAQAKERGLVDYLGTLEQAIASAADLAGLSKFSPVYIEGEISLRDQLLQRLSVSIQALFPDLPASSPARGLYRKLRQQLDTLVLMDDPHGIYAHAMLQLPY